MAGEIGTLVFHSFIYQSCHNATIQIVLLNKTFFVKFNFSLMAFEQLLGTDMKRWQLVINKKCDQLLPYLLL